MIPNKIPRRICMDQWTPAEKAIHDAVQVVEVAGAHPLLTDAVVLLSRARDTVADFVDLKPRAPISVVATSELDRLQKIELLTIRLLDEPVMRALSRLLEAVSGPAHTGPREQTE